MQKFIENKLRACVAMLAILVCGHTTAYAQDDWNHIDTSGYYRADSSSREGYTLVFINKDSAFSSVTGERMKDAFYKVYPAEVKRFNPASLKRVVFIIDPAYDGVAATSGGIVRYNPVWLAKHPEDIDVVTHEVMHIVQAYGDGGEGWLTEGIADYVRYRYGVNNEKGNWSLPELKPSQKYTDAYRVTARFLAWLEKNVRPSVVDEMDAASRNGTYSPALWKKLTGKTPDQLWQQYAANPAL